MRLVALAALLTACGGGSDPDPTTTPAPGTTDTGTWVPSYDCATDVPELPLEVTDRIGGFTGAEDFAIDDEGRYVATDDFGNLVRIEMNGDVEVWVPNLGSTAGTAFLSDGTLVIAVVDSGEVVRVRKNGSTQTLISGLSYPNGLTVSDDDVVYIADQNLGEILSWDGETRETLATGLFNPNGVTLSVDQQTLYVGSFGGATVHAIDLTTGAVELFGMTPVDTTTLGSGACAGLYEGDECFLDAGIGIGECDAVGDCVLTLDTGACASASTGDPCQTDTLGEVNDSVCAPHPSGYLFCPEVPGEVVTACFGKSEGDPCTAMSIDRECRNSWEGILVCDITPWTDVSIEACVGSSIGDDCVIEDVEGYAQGTCGDDPYGPDTICSPDWGGGYSFQGGLDGIGVDACGYVWVTEYTLGYVWRFPPEGGDPELGVATGTFWIPNLHWGNGAGGFDEETMYVQDRFTDELLAVPIGLPDAGGGR